MPVPAPLISTPDQVTPEWLTDALVASGAAPAGAAVTGFEAEGIGTGQVGQNVRFTLEWAGTDDEPLPTVVGKFAAADETSRQAGLLTGTYVREVNFYRELSDRCAMRIPRCHVAELEPTTGDFVLLFEDITPAVQGDQIAGCSVDEAAMAMVELGRLHSSYWNDPTLTDHEWLVPRNGDARVTLRDMYQAFVGQFVAQYGDSLSDRAVTVAEGFTPHVLDWLATDAEPFTVLHTDYRLDNMLFGTGDGAPPLTVVDWQTPALGAGTSDAAYFLGSGLDIEDRRTHERDLLGLYRSSLAAGGVDLDEDTCWTSYRANAVAGLHMAVVASVLVGRHDRGDAMFCAMTERHAAAIHDLETLELLAGS